MINKYWFKKLPFYLIAIFTILSILIPMQAHAAASEIVVNPSADAYVISTSPDANYGSKSSIRVDNSPTTRSYLRFEVTGVDWNAVQSAKLRVYANSANSTGYDVNVVNDSSWQEKTITYKASPTIGDFVNKSGKIKAGTWTEVDLTGLFVADGTYNLAITSKSNTATNLASREASGKSPQLVLYTGDGTLPTNTPEPTSVPTQAPAPTSLPTIPSEPTSVPTTGPTVTALPTAGPTLTLEPTIIPTVGSTLTTQPTNLPGTDWQPSFPIRAAFYYPWFPEAWNQQNTYPYTNFTPTLGYYNNSDQAILKKHIDMMQYGNIQAGIASWWGQGSRSDNRVADLLTSAQNTNFRWSLYYENESLGNPSSSQVNADLQYINDKYGKDPSFLRVNGKFVVFVYADATDGCAMADRWKTGNTVGAYIVLKVFAGYKTCANQPDGWHQYSPAVALDQQGSESFSVSPGFWLKGQPVRLARDLTRWNQNVKDMAASNAKWQLVTTFSEWGEGTIVEPAAEWASASGYGQYLDVLHENGNGSVPQPTQTVIPTSTPLPGPNATPTVAPTAGPMTPPVIGQSNTLLLAGDICKYNVGSTNYTGNCKKTGDLIRSILSSNQGATVQTLGDNINNDGGSTSYDAEYTDLYDPNWGSFKDVTRSVMGNHDTYAPGGTTPYFDYFGTTAGSNPGGYYSYDIGANWHVIALNAQCSQAGGCGTSSPQYKWLQSDLAANTKKCVIAVWHQPRWTSGRHSDDATSAPWWDILYQYKVDIVANGHNHNYERFNLIDPNQNAAADGIREFIVGTGGAPSDGYSYASKPLDPNEAIRNQTGVFGVLKLTLGDGAYSWDFVPVPGSTFTDSGTTLCH